MRFGQKQGDNGEFVKSINITVKYWGPQKVSNKNDHEKYFHNDFYSILIMIFLQRNVCFCVLIKTFGEKSSANV